MLAYGGRFDNSIAHYQIDLKKFLPSSVGVTFRTSQIVSQLLNQNQKKLKTAYSHIDVVIGSIGNSLVREKVNLMTYLQDNLKLLKVHVDYSDDIISNVIDEFLRENNVQYLVQLHTIGNDADCGVSNGSSTG